MSIALIIRRYTNDLFTLLLLLWPVFSPLINTINVNLRGENRPLVINVASTLLSNLILDSVFSDYVVFMTMKLFV